MTSKRMNLLGCSLIVSASCLGVACGGDDTPVGGGAGAGGDDSGGMDGSGGTDGAGGSTGGTGGSGMGGDTGTTFSNISEVVAKKVSFAANLYGVSFTDDGLIYVSGDTLVDTDDPAVVVARLDANGDLDTDFGGGAGYVELNSIAKGDDNVSADTVGFEESFSITAMPDGGAVVAINRNNGASGQEVVLARLDANGDLDTDFDTDGYAPVTMGDEVTAANQADWSYDVLLDTSATDNRLVVFGQAPAEGNIRMDEDRYIARLMASDGSMDTDFDDDGVFSLDAGEHEVNDDTRRGLVLDDGSVVSSGYAELSSDDHHVYLIKLDASGEPDASFGFFDSEGDCGTEQDGVLCMNPFAGDGYAEAYAVAMQDGQPLTTGYGEPEAGQAGAQDLVSFRFGADALDSSYATAGGLILDSGAEDRGRDLEILDDGRVVHVGKRDEVAAVYVTDADGTLWDGFGDSGIKSYSSHDGNLRGVATQGGVIAAVGDNGSGTEASLVILKVDE